MISQSSGAMNNHNDDDDNNMKIVEIPSVIMSFSSVGVADIIASSSNTSILLRFF